MKIKSIMCGFLLMVLISGCNPPEVGESTIAFDYALTGIIQQILGVDQKPASFDAKTLQSVTGFLVAENLDTGVVDTIPWYGTLDMDTFHIISTKTIVLPPGPYAFTLTLTGGIYQYYAVAQALVTEGDNLIHLTLQPVFGEVITELTVDQVASLRFNYDPGEINEAGIANPAVGVIVDDSPEVIILLNPATGLSEACINLIPGPHTIRVLLYDTGLLIARSFPDQEAVMVVLKQDITINLIPLHGEVEFTLEDGEEGPATFRFLIPDEIVQETGDTSNLEALLRLEGPANGLHEVFLNLIPDGPNYTAVVNLDGFFYDTISIYLAFRDIAADDVVATFLVSNVVLDENNKTIIGVILLRRRAFITGNLLAVAGLNVFDESAFPVVGASIYIDGVFRGITGSVHTAGYLQVFLVRGNHLFRAIGTDLRYGEISAWVAAFSLNNLDIILNNTEGFGNPANGHIYKLIPGPFIWHDAVADAAVRGGYPATLTSALENNLVHDLLVGPSGEGILLGGNDEDSEGTWCWVTGEPWVYTNWRPGEPNDNEGQEDCLQFLPGNVWNDARSNHAMPYILELE